MARRDLAGTSVVVAGAGLAGLSAARALERAARPSRSSRRAIGSAAACGRSATGSRAAARRGGRGSDRGRAGARPGPRPRAGTEARADPARGFRLLRTRRARPAPHPPRSGLAGPRSARLLKPEIEDFKLAEERWDSAVAGPPGAARPSRNGSSGRARPQPFKAAMRGFRGFFLADPEDLSLLPLVEQFAESGPPGRGEHLPDPRRQRSARHRDGEASPGLAAAGNRRPPRSSSAGDGVRVTIEDRGGRRSELGADYFVCALPASTARERDLRAGAAGAAARRDRAPSLRLRHAAAAAVRAAVLAKRGRPNRLRHRPADRRRLGRKRAAARTARHL